MKIFTHLFKFKTVALIAMLFFVSAQVEATHFRYGTLSWEVVSYTPTSRTVQFTITQSWRRSYFGNPSVGATVNNVGNFLFGDGSGTNLSLVVTSVNANAAEDWFVGTRTLTKVYYTTNNVLAFFQGCCRISSLQQNNNDKNFRLETVVTLSNPENSAPVGSTLPIFYVQTGLPNAQIQLNATDPDNDPISFAVSSSAQSGLVTTTPLILTSLSTSGLLSLNTIGAFGRQYAMQVMVSDDQGARVPLDFIIQVVGVSNPPIFDYTVTPLNSSTFKVQPGVPINFTVKATDVDPGSTVALNASGIPVGATLSPQVGVNPAQVNFSWIPTNANLGTYSLSFSATDNIFVQSLTNVNIVVSLAPVFDVPPTPAIGVHNVVAPGDNLTFTVQATDPDPLDLCAITEVNGKDMMTNNKIPIYTGVTMTPALPTASSNTASSVFSWTPTAAQWGHKHAIFTAQDSYGDKTDHEVSILVNTTPQFTSTPVTSVIATQNYQYNITSTDPDVLYGDILSLHSASVLPAWLTLTDNGDGTGTLTGTPGIGDAGIYNISLEVHDINHHTNVGGIPTQTFTIEVIPCLIEISGTPTDLLCAGDNGGAIDIALSGNYGTPSFAWTGPDGYTAASEDISGLAAGSYTVIVSSDLGCSETETFVVGTTPDLTPPTATGYDATFTAQYFTGTNFNVLAVTDEVSTINNHWSYGSPYPVEIGNDNFSIRYTGKTIAPVTGNYIFRTHSDDGIRLWVNGQLIIDNWTLHAGTYDIGSIALTANQEVDIKLEFFEYGGYAIARLEWYSPDAGINSYQAVPARSNSCKNLTIQLDESGLASITTADIDPGFTDACGIESMTLSKTDFDCSNIGSNTVVLTVVDVNENQSTCTATVTVQDNIAPTITCPANIVTNNDSGICGAVVNYTVSSSDNCSGQIVIQTAGLASGSEFTVGTTINTFVVTDASGNTATCSFDVTVNNTPPLVTGITGPATPTELGNSINITVDNNDNNLTNAEIDWDDLTPLENITNPSTGSFDASHTYDTPGVYTVSVTLTDACGEVSATYHYQYVVIYDPNGGFVTGGGWFNSPECAYKLTTGVTGKANFGFVAKYKKGSTVPDGNTEFQFKAGGINFHSSIYDDMRLVIANHKANYTGTGTINGTGNYGFLVSAIDGQIKGDGIDKFRIKIWDKDNGNNVVYDNNCLDTDENSDPATAIGGGSIVIHSSKTKSAEIATAIEPEVGLSELKAYPNPFSDKLFFEFSREEDTKATLILFDGVGRKISVLFDQQIQGNQNYRIEYVPNGLSTNMLFYRMTFDNEVINGKVIYKK